MHPLQNGSQVTQAPTPKNPVGDPGYFTESNAKGEPSHPGFEFFNAQILEFVNVLNAAGVEFDSGRFDHLARAFSGQRNEMLRALVFTPIFNTLNDHIRNTDLIVPSVGQKIYIDEYPTVWELLQNKSNVIAETEKSASILNGSNLYVAWWGVGEDSNGQFFTPPNASEFMHYKAAGKFGTAGSFKDDHMQNITGTTQAQHAQFLGDIPGPLLGGALRSIPKQFSNVKSSLNGDSINLSSFDFDASRVARTDDFTDTMGAFATPEIILPKGYF